MDTNNAFNSINRKEALRNIQGTCPSFNKSLINSYHSPLRLIILGDAERQSTEGTTQGDNLAMHLYALAKVKIQYRLQITASEVKQVWLADYATRESLRSGGLTSLRKVVVMDVMLMISWQLGAVIGSNDFRRNYVNKKITEWCSELKNL